MKTRPLRLAENCGSSVPSQGIVNKILTLLIKLFLIAPFKLGPFVSLLYWLSKWLKNRGNLKQVFFSKKSGFAIVLRGLGKIFFSSSLANGGGDGSNPAAGTSRVDMEAILELPDIEDDDGAVGDGWIDHKPTILAVQNGKSAGGSNGLGMLLALELRRALTAGAKSYIKVLNLFGQILEERIFRIPDFLRNHPKLKKHVFTESRIELLAQLFNFYTILELAFLFYQKYQLWKINNQKVEMPRVPVEESLIQLEQELEAVNDVQMGYLLLQGHEVELETKEDVLEKNEATIGGYTTAGFDAHLGGPPGRLSAASFTMTNTQTVVIQQATIDQGSSFANSIDAGLQGGSASVSPNGSSNLHIEQNGGPALLTPRMSTESTQSAVQVLYDQKVQSFTQLALTAAATGGMSRKLKLRRAQSSLNTVNSNQNLQQLKNNIKNAASEHQIGILALQQKGKSASRPRLLTRSNSGVGALLRRTSTAGHAGIEKALREAMQTEDLEGSTSNNGMVSHIQVLDNSDYEDGELNSGKLTVTNQNSVNRLPRARNSLAMAASDATGLDPQLMNEQAMEALKPLEICGWFRYKKNVARNTDLKSFRDHLFYDRRAGVDLYGEDDGHELSSRSSSALLSKIHPIAILKQLSNALFTMKTTICPSFRRAIWNWSIGLVPSDGDEEIVELYDIGRENVREWLAWAFLNADYDVTKVSVHHLHLEHGEEAQAINDLTLFGSSGVEMNNALAGAVSNKSTATTRSHGASQLKRQFPLPEQQWRMTSTMIHRIEQWLQHKFRPGYNDNIVSMRLTLDPLQADTRSFLFYGISQLVIPFAGDFFLKKVLGFEENISGTMSYYVRKPVVGKKKKENNTSKRKDHDVPFVFCHGLGLGPHIYVLFLFELVKNYPDRDIFVINIPQIACRISDANIASAREMVSCIADMLAHHYESFNLWDTFERRRYMPGDLVDDEVSSTSEDESELSGSDDDDENQNGFSSGEDKLQLQPLEMGERFSNASNGSNYDGAANNYNYAKNLRSAPEGQIHPEGEARDSATMTTGGGTASLKENQAEFTKRMLSLKEKFGNHPADNRHKQNELQQQNQHHKHHYKPEHSPASQAAARDSAAEATGASSPAQATASTPRTNKRGNKKRKRTVNTNRPRDVRTGNPDLDFDDSYNYQRPGGSSKGSRGQRRKSSSSGGRNDISTNPAELDPTFNTDSCPGAHFIGHSFGTFVMAWMIRRRPHLVAYATLIDPVCFRLFSPDIAYNMVYREPKTWIQTAIQYFVAKEIHVAQSMARRMVWQSWILWPEKLKFPTNVILSGLDSIIPAHSIRTHLVAHSEMRRQKMAEILQKKKNRWDKIPKQVKKKNAKISVLWLPNLGHAEFMVRPRAKPAFEEIIARIGRLEEQNPLERMLSG
ncbi:unnamed protein product [Amoebophrya sp. A120]|nr:unnamed protein product [Amoebophrya sp. A120]|eukprot:GSA120T00013324001.1